MSWIAPAVLLSIFVLHCLPVAIGWQAKVTVTNSWTGNLQGKIEIDVSEDINDYEIKLEFSVSLTNLQFYTANVVPTQGKVFTVTSPDWYKFNGNQKGTVLELDFDATGNFDADAGLKLINWLTLNGEEVPLADEQPPTAGPSPSGPTTNISTTRPPGVPESTTEPEPITVEQTTTKVVSSWYDGFHGRIEFNLPDDVTDGWIIKLLFSVPTPIVDIWDAQIGKNQDNKTYELINKSWNSRLSKGTIFQLDFIAQKSVFNGNATTGKVTFTSEVPSTGQLPTAGPSTSGPPGVPESITEPIDCIDDPSPPDAEPAESTYAWRYDYEKVLNLSILFYEAQRSGKLPQNNRVEWRKDSALDDKGENGEDLTGGWYDAGDYVKFGFPMAYSATVLAWGLVEYKGAYIAAGQYDNMLDCIKWATDYFIKAHTKKYEFYGQVGDAEVDHKYYGRPEDMTMARPAWKITPQKPGSDLAAETAAALAAASIAFNVRNTTCAKKYALKLLKHAEELYEFADKYRGKYSDSISDADKFYHSNGYEDELVWGAAWLHRATKNETYLTKAEMYYHEFEMGDEPPWSFDWDVKTAGVQLLLYQFTKNDSYVHIYKEAIESFVDYCMGIRKTPGGQTHLSDWGSNRYAANAAFLALVAADLGIKRSEYRAYADQQIGYMLGDSGRSFVVEFGPNSPKQPRHRASACPSAPAQCDFDTFSDTSKDNAHVLYGALVGGPRDLADKYVDLRTDYITNEVTTNYNAGFQSAVAGLMY